MEALRRWAGSLGPARAGADASALMKVVRVDRCGRAPRCGLQPRGRTRGPRLQGGRDFWLPTAQEERRDTPPCSVPRSLWLPVPDPEGTRRKKARCGATGALPRTKP